MNTSTHLDVLPKRGDVFDGFVVVSRRVIGNKIDVTSHPSYHRIGLSHPMLGMAYAVVGLLPTTLHDATTLKAMVSRKMLVHTASLISKSAV